MVLGLGVRGQTYPTVYFTNMYQGDSTATYATNTQSIKVVKLLLGSDFRFVGQVPGATFTASSGNNVNGTLKYTDPNGNPFSINGTISRQDKKGSTVQAFYFYANANHAYLFILPTYESSYNQGSTYSTSSDFSVSDINTTLANQATLTSSFLSTCLNSSGPSLTAKVSGTVSKYEWYSNTNNAASTSSPAVLVATRTTNANSDTYTPSTSSAGTLYYFVKVTLSGGSVYTNTQGITINALPSISVQPSTSTQSICQNGIATSLSIEASAGSGTGPTYQWYRNTTSSNSNGTLISGATNSTFSPSTSSVGTLYYYCVVSNSNGCSITSNPSGAITVNSNALVGGVINGGTSVCTGTNSTSLTLSGYTAGSSITRWESSSLSDFSSGVGTISNTSTNYTVTNLSSTTYYRAILTNSGCTFQSSSATVNVNPNTAINVQPSTTGQSLCQNATPVLLNVTAVGGGLTYQWYSNSSNNNTTGTLIGSATNSSYSPPTSTVGTKYYYVSVTGTCGGTITSTVSGAIVISSLSATLTISSGSTITCGGSSNLSIAFTGTAPWDISYSDGTNTTTVYSNATNPYLFTVSPKVTTTYSLTALVDGNFCNSTPNSNVTVSVNLPSAPTVAITQPTCNTATGTVSVTSGITGLSFTLSNGSNTYANSTGIFNNVPSGSYSLTSTSSGGCTSNSLSVTINTQPASPTATISAGGATTFCSGGNVILTASSATSYLWSTGATTQSITASSSGSYSVTITNASGCSATSTATTVTVNSLPTVASITGTANVCIGSTTTFSSSGTWSSSSWSSGTTSVATINSSGVITGVSAGSSIITYTVTNASGCSSSTTKTVTVNALPTSTISAGGATTFCSGGNVILTASNATGYLWSTGATTQSITASSSGSYSVTVTNASGCSATSTATTVTVNALPSVNIGSIVDVASTATSFNIPYTIISGTPISYSIFAGTPAMSGFSNVVDASPIPTSPILVTIPNSTANNYSFNIQFKDGNACTRAYNISLNVTDASKLVSTIAMTGTTSFTYNNTPQGPNTFTKTGSTASPTFNYSGTGSTNYGPSSILPTNVGNYEVVATLASDANYNGASSAAYAFTINQAASTIVATGTITYTYNGTAQGPITSTVSGSTGAVTYSYSGTGTTTYGPSSTLPTAAGTYQVIATVAGDANYNGATSAAYAFTINQATSTIVATGTITYTYNGTAQGPTTSTVSGSTGVVTYSYSGTSSTTYGPSATLPTAAGTYQVIATVAGDANYNGASSAAYAFTINQAASTIVATGTITYTYNGTAQGPTTSSVTGSTGAVTYSYSGTGTTTYGPSSTLPTAAGTYQVIATVAGDANYNGATSAAYAFSIIDAPTVISINRVESTPTNLSILHFLVTFSKDINGFDVSDLNLISTGTVSATSMIISTINASTYTVTVNGISGNGTLGINLNNTGTNIVDINGTGISNGITGQVYLIDKVTLTPSINSPGSGSSYAGNSLGISINIPEVNLANSIRLTFSGISNNVTTTLNNSTGNISGNLNLNNLALSSIVASSSQATLPSDIYTVTLSYQDYLGNPAASATINNLRINYGLTSTIVATGTTTYTYNGATQGPTTSTVTGSTGAVTYSYSGTGTTTYGPSSTLPTAAGTYQVIATVSGDANYNGASSAAYAFTINKAASTIVATGTTTYTYNGAAQGPTTSTVTGSTGSVTYSYSGNGSTNYGPSATLPTAAGTYQVIATVAGDANYNGASSATYAFTINKATSTIVATGATTFTYNATAQGPTTSTVTGSTGSVTYSYSGTGASTYGPSVTPPKLPGTYQVIATVTGDANYNGATSTAYSFTILQSLVPPTVINASYIINQSNLPSTLAVLVTKYPAGTVPAWCDINTLNCTTIAPKMPTIIGKYVYQLRSYDTTTLLYSNNFVNDTLLIAPPKPNVVDSTYVIGVTSNPSNAGVQASGIIGATFNYFYLNNKLASAPALGTVPGTKTYTVSQTVNSVEGDTATFNVNLLDPNSIIHLQKIVDSGKLQSNSTFNYPFTFIVSNLTKYPFSNVVVTDNLHNSVPITSDFNVINNIAKGGLVANSRFDGNNDINITSIASSLAPLTIDTARFTMNLIPKGFSGTLTNIAYVKADTKWGTITMQSSSSAIAGTNLPTTYFVKDLSINIPEGFSPNHDGVHDYFVIIKPYNITIDIQIFNRWGNQVYSNNNYNNDWDGKGTGNFAGQDLVDGGYYYKIKAIDDKGAVQILNGFVIIQR